jgi:hypothetical protein
MLIHALVSLSIWPFSRSRLGFVGVSWGLLENSSAFCLKKKSPPVHPPDSFLMLSFLFHFVSPSRPTPLFVWFDSPPLNYTQKIEVFERNMQGESGMSKVIVGVSVIVSERGECLSGHAPC